MTTYLQDLGAAEKFFSIPGHPNHMISITGRVVNVQTGRELSVWPEWTGRAYYPATSLGRIHRLLASALIGRVLARHEHVRHLDGNSFNYSVSNLCIGTPRDNAKDKIDAGTNGRKLTNQRVREIRAVSDRLSVRQLAERFGVSVSSIRAILARRRWQNLP